LLLVTVIIKAETLTFVLPTEKSLVVLFWTFFNVSATTAN